MNISGNTILITGGTSGIGRALAEALHAKGNTVVIAGRRQQLLDEITGKHPGMVGIALDVTDSKSIASFAADVKQRFPKLNVLFNNAGIARDVTDSKSIASFAADVKQRFPKLNVLFNNAGIARMEDYTADHIDTADAVSTIQTNITSVLELTAALLPTLRAQPHSTLAVTTSGLAFVPFPPGPTYSATKAFLHNWLDAVRFQLRNTTVEVLEIAPPYVQTEFGGPQQAADPRAMPLADYTAEVMDILEHNRIEKGEVLVERVKPMRNAEKEGTYASILEHLGNF